MEDELSYLERMGTRPQHQKRGERMLKRYILWLAWSLVCIGLGYWWAWEAMGGRI